MSATFSAYYTNECQLMIDQIRVTNSRNDLAETHDGLCGGA